MRSLTHLPGQLRRRVLVHRRALAALLAGLAVLVGLRAVQAPAPAAVQVWAASRDLAAGIEVAQADLTRIGLLPDAVPDGAVTDPRSLVGRTLAAPLRRGTPVTDLSVVDRPLAQAWPGRVAAPVRLSDPAVVGLLRVGDVVDLVVADPQGETPAHVLASGVAVVAIPRRAQPTGDVGIPGRLVLLAVPEGDAATVAAAGVSGYLTITFSR
jgi:Flp pilus assembly protein CpaB